MTWFKKYGPSNWINLSLQDTLKSSASDIIARLRGQNSDCTNTEPERR
jgi:hypothetical protein